jgi:methyltransferase
MFPLALLVLVFAPMLLEARRSARNEHVLRGLGAVEPSGDVYRLMQVLYPVCFVAMIAEAWLRHRTLSPAVVPGAIVLVAAKALKYWAIASLGSRWSFRVLVPPLSSPTSAGPYRFMRHPNYVAVLGELTGAALMARAPVSGVLSVFAFGALLLVRIRVEERALGIRTE